MERERVCRAFRDAYEQAGLTQEALRDRINANENEASRTSQGTISKYARGETQPPLDFLAKVDAALGRAPGHVLRLAGYVDDCTVPDAIAADPSLTKRYQDDVLTFYEYVRERSTQDAR